MDVHEQVINIVRAKGPLLPAQVSKEINSDILMASAILAELSSNNKVKVSNTKVGGSPLYYLSGQEFKLQNFTDSLHEKEKRAFEMLRQERLVEDKSLELVNRVALRQIKDFAKPIEVEIDGESKLFWKWYLLRAEDAEQLIRERYLPEKPNEKVKPEVAAITVANEEQKQLQPQLQEKVIAKPLLRKTRKKPVEDFTEFNTKTASFFKRNEIEVLEQRTVKRNTETDYMLLVPSAVGKIKYYCKVRKKDKISETDLGAAFAQSQLKNLPALYITNGMLTKKAVEALEKEYRNVTVKKI